MERIIPDFKKSLVTSFMGFDKKNQSPENVEQDYLKFLYERERVLEDRLIKLFDHVNIRAMVKSDPYSLPFHEEIVVTRNGTTDMNYAFDFTPVAKIILKTILNKEVDKVRFYMFFNATDKGFMGFGELEYRFRYIVPVNERTKKFSKKLGGELSKIHTHGELVKDNEIVYREKDVINLLNDLGHPKPTW